MVIYNKNDRKIKLKIFILKGWFNMEEIKNGIISEEALDEIAGGLNISKEKVVGILKKVGITIGAAATVTTAIAGAFVGGAFAQKDKDVIGTTKEKAKGIWNNITGKKDGQKTN